MARMIDDSVKQILFDIRKKIENLSEETYVRNANGCMDKKRPKTANEFKQSVLRLFDSYLNEK